MAGIEGRILKLMDKYLLERIDFRVTRYSVVGNAIPVIHHPKVEQRRTEAFKEHEGNSLTLDQVMKITDEATKSIAAAKGNTFEEVIDNLDAQLKKSKDEINI